MSKFNPDLIKEYKREREGCGGTWVLSADHDRAIMEQAAEYQAIIGGKDKEISTLKDPTGGMSWNQYIAVIEEKNKEIAALKDGRDILLDDLEKRSLVISRMSAELVPPLSRFYEGKG